LLGKRLHDKETEQYAVFEFPNAKENGVTLLPDKDEILGELRVS